MILLNFLRKLIKDDGFELVDANSKSYLIGKPKKENPIRLKILDKVPVSQYRHGKDIVPLVPPLMRRHNKLLEFGRPGSSYIKDHFMLNYVKMSKSPEYY